MAIDIANEWKEFVEKNGENWENVLKEEGIDIRERDGYKILNGPKVENGVEWSMMRQICRGMIVDKEQPTRIVSVGHLHSSSFETKDWIGKEDKERVEELETMSEWMREKWTFFQSISKVTLALDGSQIRFWYDKEKWHLSTTRTINASYAPIYLGTRLTFYDLVADVYGWKTEEDFTKWCESHLQKDRMYTFVLVHEMNRIVCPNKGRKEMYLVQVRNCETLNEVALEEIEETDQWKQLPLLSNGEVKTFGDWIEEARKEEVYRKYEIGEGYMVETTVGDRLKIPFMKYEEWKGLKGSMKLFKPIFKWCDLQTPGKEQEKEKFLQYYDYYVTKFEMYDRLYQSFVRSALQIYREVYVKRYYRLQDTDRWFYRNYLYKVHGKFLEKRKEDVKYYVKMEDMEEVWRGMDAPQRCFILTRYHRLSSSY